MLVATTLLVFIGMRLKERIRPGILKVAILLEEEKGIDKTLMYPSLRDDYVFNLIDGYYWYLNIPSLKNYL